MVTFCCFACKGPSERATCFMIIGIGKNELDFDLNIISRNSAKFYAFGSLRRSVFKKKNRITHKGQRTPEGHQGGERWPASSPGRRGQRPIVSAGTAVEAIALGTPWVAGAAPKPHAKQPRRGYCKRFSERSRDLGRCSCGLRGEEGG